MDVVEFGLSDHRLLKWSIDLRRPPPTYVTSSRRCWRDFDDAAFTRDLAASAICDPSRYAGLAVDDLSDLYDVTIKHLLDRHAPARCLAVRQRPSSVWFDDECRSAKRQLRRLERDVRRQGRLSDNASPAAIQWRAERRRYVDLLHRKRSRFWVNRVDDDRSNPRRLWRTFNHLLGRGGGGVEADVSASDLHRAFDAKVAGVRSSTEDGGDPEFTDAPSGCVLDDLGILSVTDVVSAISSLPCKQCLSDPWPTHLLKRHSCLVAPFLTHLFNISFQSGYFPASFKSAYVTPLLKKPGLDPLDPKSYRPISNLSVISKLLERLVSKRLVSYLSTNGLLPNLQSAYIVHRSTETAVLRVVSDILSALDSGNLALLALLDLTAAFDSVDHQTLITRLSRSYGLSGSALLWFQSYLSGRTQSVRISNSHSDPLPVLFGVPQGSVLGPILFLLYVADLLSLVKRHQLIPHTYADDTQIYGFCRPPEVSSLADRLSKCTDDVAAWMRANRLQLNSSKTEVLWCSSSRRLHQIPTDPVRIADAYIQPVASVRDLGVQLDNDVSMTSHVRLVSSSCYAALRHIRSVKSVLPRHALLTLVQALVVNRIDYCNSMLVGLPTRLLDRLQAVLNSAARLICSARRNDHITPILRELHWLRIPERITFKICTLTYRCLEGSAPPYLSELLQRTTAVAARRRLRSASTAEFIVPVSRRSTLGDRSFSVAGPRAWNSLPAHIRNSPSLTVFRRELKAFLFSRSF